MLKEVEIKCRNRCYRQQAYDVPEEAPTNLPEGEDEGYPMLIYQFMHAQVPGTTWSCSRLDTKIVLPYHIVVEPFQCFVLFFGCGVNVVYSRGHRAPLLLLDV